jgi:D-amino-acid dehydrogenase
MQVTVIGAGITGITTAYFLAKAKNQVTVVDEQRYPAMGTSFANGGQLSASNAEVWNSWRSVHKGIKWLFKKDAPLLINPKPSIEKYQWLAQFLTHIKDREHNTRKTCEMAIEAHLLYKQIALEEGIEFDKVEKGILHIYRSEKELAFAKDTNRLYKEAGLDRWQVGKDEILQIEPALKNSISSIVGGFYNTQDFTGDIHKFCVELAKVLESKYGVKFKQKTIDKNTANKMTEDGPVVVCAGTGSRAIGKFFGDSIPIYPIKGYSITVDNPGPAPWVSLLDDEAKIVTARLGEGRLRVAGTAELNGYNTDIVQSRIRPLKQWVETLFPEVNMESITPWAGLRPMTPNMMPIVRRSNNHLGVWYNTGHGHLGWTLSAYTAREIAILIGKH